MSRVKRSVHAHKKHRNILGEAKGYFGTKKSSYRKAKEAYLKAQTYAYRDRRVRKRDFRQLWITRINAAARLNGMSYNQFMHGLKVANIDLNRKTLADLAVQDPQVFAEIATRAKEALAEA